MFSFTFSFLKTKTKTPSISATIGKLVSENNSAGALEALRNYSASSSTSDNNSSNSGNDTSNSVTLVPTSALTATLYCCERNNSHQSEVVELAKQLDAEGKIKWDESSLTTLQRLQCASGNIAGAGATIRTMEMLKIPLKRRSIAPLAKLCSSSTVSASSSSCSSNSTSSSTDQENAIFYGLHLYDLCQKHHVEFAPQDLASFSNIFVSAEKNEKFKNVKLTTDQADSSSSSTRISQMLLDFSEHASVLEKEQEVDDHVAVAMKNLLSPASSSSISSTPRFGRECTIDLESGSCSCCGNKLDANPLTQQDAKELQGKIEIDLVNYACSKIKSKNDDQKKKKENHIRASFKSFQDFFIAGKFDVLIDGANVGYYGLSSWYDGAASTLKSNKKNHVAVDVPPNYEFVDLAFTELERMGLKPLIVFHSRHLERLSSSQSSLSASASSCVNVSNASSSSSSEMIVDRWRRKRSVFATPSGLNDDICWLWALVASSAKKGDEETNNKVKILTNDLMRDHIFSLLSSKTTATKRSLARLRDRKRIQFRAGYKKEEKKTELFLHFPPVFSSFLQRNSTQSSSASSSCSSSWHVPYYHYNDNQQTTRKQGEDEQDQEEIPEVRWKCFSSSS